MNIVADESVDRSIVDSLRKAGHHVSYIAEQHASISDSEVLKIANREKAILVTADKDFGEMIVRLKRLSEGVVLLRLSGLSAERKNVLVSSAFLHHGDEFLASFSVVSPANVRIRKLGGSV
ncbi:MAG: DUF5615 family PIN-like protein [Deltaproteobacteria bacterium]|nr:DUF5615 family PIN-like protein [Deltaproteobacteria bacterium]